MKNSMTLGVGISYHMLIVYVILYKVTNTHSYPLLFDILTVIHKLCLGPDPVENVTLSFNTTSSTFNRSTGLYSIGLELSWTAPVETNGNIAGYQFNVTESGTSTQVLSDSTTATSLDRLLNAIKPYTNYTLSVVASTTGGSSDVRRSTAESPEAGEQCSVNIV